MTGDENGRTRVTEPRADGVREWEAFVRTASGESLRHVGSVTAPTAETAHEHAGALFPSAEALWLCPTDEVVRFATRTLGECGDSADDGSTVEAESPPESEADAGIGTEAGGDRP